MAWLGTWAKRVKLTIDQTDIDDVLSNFPILVYLSTASGINDDDVSCVFDELQSDANRKKIAVTTSDGTTQCYAEIEKWDDANEYAWLWVKVPSVAADVDTDLYLYYDRGQPDNSSYVGDIGDTPAKAVWDASFFDVLHLPDGADTSHVTGSKTGTSYSKVAAGAPAVTTSGKIANAQDVDGVDDYISFGSPTPSTQFVYEAWIKPDNVITYRDFLAIGIAGGITNTGDVRIQGSNVDTYWNITGGAAGRLGTTILSVGIWYRVTVVFETNQFPVLYINGAAEGATGGALVAIGGTGWSARVGLGLYNDGSPSLDGLIDEVRLSLGTLRSATWFKASYESEVDDLLDFGSEELLLEPAAWGFFTWA